MGLVFPTQHKLFCSRQLTVKAVTVISWLSVMAPLSAQSDESTLSATLVVDSSLFSVAQQDKHSVTRALLDVGYEYHSEALTLFISGQAQRGDNGSDFIGDIQAFSNIDEDDFEKLYEAWGQYTFDKTGTRLKAGQMDVNGEFAYADNAGEFINSSMGFSPTIFTLPTYPEPAMGVMLAQTFSEQHELAIGINAGADHDDFDDLFYIAEWRYSRESFTLKLGGWKHTGEFERLSDGFFENGAKGYYLVAEGQWPDSELGYYFQFAGSNEQLSEINRHLGFGVLLEDTGMENVLGGVGVSAVWLSDWLQAEQSTEIAWEAFLRYDLNEHVAIKPDLQYIASPSGENRNEFVATLRLEISY